MTQETPRIPSYLEAFTKGLSDRDRIRLFLTLDLFTIIPERVDTGYFGITVSREELIQRVLSFVNAAPDELVAEVVKLGKKRFS